MPSGLSHVNMDPQGFMALQRDFIAYQQPLTTNYFSSATAGGSAGNFSIATSVVGDSVFISDNAAFPLMAARRPQATMTDASGSDLRVTIRITGKRFGKTAVQDIACVASGTAVEGTRVIDEITSIKIISITANAASDVLVVGFDGKWAGLLKPIKSFRDLNMVHRRVGTTADTAPKTKTTFTSAMVNVQDSAIDLNAIYGGSAPILAADCYQVEYFANGQGPAFVERSGKRLG